MQRIIKGIAALLLFMLGFTASAQNAEKAKQLLDQVSAKVKSYNNISIDFKYSMTSARGGNDKESHGNLVMEGNKYVVNFMGVTRIFDGKKMYDIVPEDEEITISPGDSQKSNDLTPAKMLTFFNTGYRYAWDIIQNVKGRKIQYIKLYPSNPKDNTKEILMGIDVQTKNIYNYIQTEKDGSRITITINSFRTNQPLSKNHFTFTESKYPNYYINKLN